MLIPGKREEARVRWLEIRGVGMSDKVRKEGEEGVWIRLAVFVEFVVNVRWVPSSAGKGEYETVVAWDGDGRSCEGLVSLL